MHYTLRHLRYFVATADNNSISDAARSLNIAQPSVSAAVDHLEKQFGVQLFLRKRSQGVKLTVAGRELLKEARGLLKHVEDFDALATNLVDEVTGEIHLACFVNIASVYLAAILRSFYAKYPKVIVRCYVGDQGDILSGIDSGLYEMALTFDLDISSQHHLEVMTELPPKLVVSANHPYAAREEISLKSINSEPFISLDLPHSRNYYDSLFQAMDLRPSRTIPVASFETIRTFVGNGLGYSLLNLETQNVTNYDGTKVLYVPLKGQHRPLLLGCLRLSNAVPRRACVAFADHVREFFAAG